MSGTSIKALIAGGVLAGLATGVAQIAGLAQRAIPVSPVPASGVSLS
jgi:hypothetical protein